MPVRTTTLGRVHEALLNLFYPPACAGCGQALPREGAASSVVVPYLCENCFADLPQPGNVICEICAEPLPGDSPRDEPGHSHNRICRRCREARPDFEYAVCPWRNRGLIEQLVHQFKYARDGRRLDLVRPLGALLAFALEDPRLREEKGIAGIVPVPLHPARERDRGFNQAAELSERLGAAAGWPVLPALQRIVQTQSQTRFTREERQTNLRKAFALDPRRREAVAGQSLIVLDDVLTTGSTLNACAKVLRKNGAARVIAVALARTAETLH